MLLGLMSPDTPSHWLQVVTIFHHNESSHRSQIQNETWERWFCGSHNLEYLERFGLNLFRLAHIVAAQTSSAMILKAT